MSVASETQRIPVIEIVPSTGWRAVDLGELWAFRELLQILVWRDVTVRYRQTLLGVLWVIAQPLLTMVIFTFLFHRVANLQADRGLPYPLFVMAALVPWAFFATGVIAASNSLIGSTHLISKVYFPRMLIPAAAVLSGVVDLGVSLLLVIAMYVWYSVAVSWTFLFLPLAVIIATAFAIGCGLWLSALNVEYRDVRVAIPFLLQLWMYVTPVVYPLQAIPAQYRWVVGLNPMTGVVETFRAALLADRLPGGELGYATAVACLVLVSGAFYFRRVERLFADLL